MALDPFARPAPTPAVEKLGERSGRTGGGAIDEERDGDKPALREMAEGLRAAAAEGCEGGGAKPMLTSSWRGGAGLAAGC